MSAKMIKDGAEYPIANIPNNYPAINISYSNTASGLNATNAQEAIDEVSATATQAYNSRIEIINIPMGDTPKTITFSGKTYTRHVNMFLIITGQAGLGAPISISFGGMGNYENISSVSVSVNSEGVTASGTSLNLPVEYNGWGFYTLIRLYPNDEITYTVS